MAIECPGDDAYAAGTVGQGHRRNLRIEQGLVTRRTHLVLGRQVHPQLHHVQRAAALAEFRRVEFLMEDAGGSGHPLHVTRADGAAGTGRIAMGDFAFVDDGDGLEAAMRMLTDPTRGFAGREAVRPGVVQQQERAQVLAMGVVGEHRTGRKAVAHPVRAGGAVGTCDTLHGDLLTGATGRCFSLRRRYRRDNGPGSRQNLPS